MACVLYRGLWSPVAGVVDSGPCRRPWPPIRGSRLPRYGRLARWGRPGRRSSEWACRKTTSDAIIPHTTGSAFVRHVDGVRFYVAHAECRWKFCLCLYVGGMCLFF